MAATVVSVVIFLCGVLVGRGVRAERAATTAERQAPRRSSPAPQAAATAPATSQRDLTRPPPRHRRRPSTDLSYFNRLQKQTRPAGESEAAPPATTPIRGGRPCAAACKSAPRNRHLRLRRHQSTPKEAAAIASRPQATVMSSRWPRCSITATRTRWRSISRRRATARSSSRLAETAPARYRVRREVQDEHEAEIVAARLQKEEQFKPWITR